MTAYEYLSQVSYIDRRIRYDLMELAELRLRASSVSSPGFEESYTKGVSTQAPFVRTLELIWQKEERLNAELKELEQKREEIRGAIERIENKDERMLLLYRYIQGLKWTAICAEMHVSLSTVKRWHKNALKIIEIS